MNINTKFLIDRARFLRRERMKAARMFVKHGEMENAAYLVRCARGQNVTLVRLLRAA
jgi:hypothetical protein